MSTSHDSRTWKRRASCQLIQASVKTTFYLSPCLANREHYALCAFQKKLSPDMWALLSRPNHLSEVPLQNLTSLMLFSNLWIVHGCQHSVHISRSVFLHVKTRKNVQIEMFRSYMKTGHLFGTEAQTQF